MDLLNTPIVQAVQHVTLMDIIYAYFIYVSIGFLVSLVGIGLFYLFFMRR
jgi:hypothetical protein